MENIEQEIARLASPLRRAASILEVVAIVGAVGGVIGGIAVAVHSETLSDGGLYSTSSTTHPWVGAGISIVGAAIVAGIFYWCVARALQLFATEAAARHGVSLAIPVAASLAPSAGDDGWGGNATAGSEPGSTTLPPSVYETKPGDPPPLL